MKLHEILNPVIKEQDTPYFKDGDGHPLEDIGTDSGIDYLNHVEFKDRYFRPTKGYVRWEQNIQNHEDFSSCTDKLTGKNDVLSLEGWSVDNETGELVYVSILMAQRIKKDSDKFNVVIQKPKHVIENMSLLDLKKFCKGFENKISSRNCAISYNIYKANTY